MSKLIRNDTYAMKRMDAKEVIECVSSVESRLKKNQFAVYTIKPVVYEYEPTDWKLP